MVAHWLARARRSPGRRRGAGLVGQPGRRLRLPGRGPGASTNRVELEVRSWSRGEIELTVEGEGRNELERGPRQPVRARRSRRRWSRPAASCPRASAGGSTCTTRSRSRAASGRRPRRRWPASSPPTRCSAARSTRRPSCASRPAIEGHPDNAAAALLGGFVVAAADADGVEALRFDVAARPARGPVHPGAAAVDRGHAQGPAGQGAARRRRRQPRAPSRSASPGWPPAGPTCCAA